MDTMGFGVRGHGAPVPGTTLNKEPAASITETDHLWCLGGTNRGTCLGHPIPRAPRGAGCGKRERD